MKETGHISLWNVDCILVTDEDSLLVIPKDKDNIKKINSHFNDQDFLIEYEGIVGHSIALIQRLQFEYGFALRLFPRYIVERTYTNSFAGFEITGEIVDDFFSPARYFYNRHKCGAETQADLIYSNEIAEKWTVNFEGNDITVTLSYGDILRWGTASDLMLHPKLTISFEKTTDIQYVYRVYSFIVRFFKIVRYDTKCGKLRIDLFNEQQGKLLLNGRLQDFCMIQNQFCPADYRVEYSRYKSYIQRFLQFASDNPKYTFYHYPSEGNRYRGMHYSATDFLNIFSAFEYECHAKKELYENVDATKVQLIKENLVTKFEEYTDTDLKPEEIEFLKNAKSRIMQLGTQFGQTQKITNAYNILHQALDRSIENIFFLPDFKLKNHIENSDMKKIAIFLTELRGKIAHGGFFGDFSDADAQKIRFLEILTYAQMLKRIGLFDEEIERVVGMIFNCNFIDS